MAPPGGVRRRRIGFPPPEAAPTGLRRAAYLLRGLVLFPVYWLAGAMFGAPGMRFRLACFGAGVRLLFAGNAADAYHCIVYPLDSVRHFEMEFFWKRLASDASARRLLATPIAVAVAGQGFQRARRPRQS